MKASCEEKAELFENVYVLDHPLIQHKLTLMRDKKTSTKEFRELVAEVSMLMCCEVTRFTASECKVETPLENSRENDRRQKLALVPDPSCRSRHG